jgi:uncharacterized membrane protein YfcA
MMTCNNKSTSFILVGEMVIMILSNRTKGSIDKFGPYGSAIGSLIGFLLVVHPSTNLYEIRVILALFLSYTFNTCVHRKYFIFSKAALAGLIGMIIGGLIGIPVSFFSIAILGFGYQAFIPWAICIMIFSFWFSWLICRNERNKENLLIRTNTQGFTPYYPYIPGKKN